MKGSSATPPRRFGALPGWLKRSFGNAAEDLRRAGAPDREARAVRAGAIFAVYAAAVLALPLYSVWSIVLAPPLFFLAFRVAARLFAQLAERPASPFAPAPRGTAPAPLTVTVLVFCVYSLLLYIFGALRTPDTMDQWDQILTRQFDDWHPVMHTFSIWIFAAVRKSDLFVLNCFIGVFALLCGWLTATLRRFGYRDGTIWTLLLLVTLSPNSLLASRVLWKDSEFALALLYLGIAMIHLWHTDGKWLAKPRHALPTAAVLIYAAFVRHNGIFFAVPFLLLLPLLPRVKAERRKLAGFALAVLLLLCGYVAGRAVLIRRGMLAGRCGDVAQKQSKQSFGEAVGMPMTMMAEAFANCPERIPADAAAFLTGIAPREKWKEFYAGDFNSVKFVTLPKSSTVFNGITPLRFFKLFLSTLAACPWSCGRAFVRLSALAWDPFFRMPGNPDAATGTAYQLVYDVGLDRLWSAPGLYLLVLVFSGAFACIRRGARVLFMTLPFLAYAFGTALLLAGWDHRFFWGVIIAAPAAIAALLRAPAEK